MSCSFPPWFEIATNITYSLFESTFEQCPRTYIRPDPGGSMMPWVLVVFLLLFHLPTCIIRAVRWESAQYLALGLAVLGIALTVQAYVSTALKADEVLVWMPLTLVLDVGAMMQMVILIIEKHHTQGVDGIRRGGLRLLWGAVRDMMKDVMMAMRRLIVFWRGERQQVPQNDPVVAERRDSFDLRHPLPVLQLDGLQNPVQPPIPMQNLRNSRRGEEEGNAENPVGDAPRPDPEHAHAFRYAMVALTAFVLLLMLLVLQVYGLYAAVKGRQQSELTVNWCSPAFRDFAVAVTTGNCQRYAVLESSSNGIGCISLPGDQQRDWLLGTIVTLSLAIFSQTFDFVLLICTTSETKYRGVKMQRPWLTMFGGIIMLVVLITFGVFNANHLPNGVTEMVWIYRKEPSRAMGRVCRGTLNAPGLRGVMIGYMDGLFESWGGVYHGHS